MTVSSVVVVEIKKMMFKRSISFSYVYWSFNRVDRKRIAEVGPDIACAEWLLRNSAFVRFKGRPKLITGW